MCGIAGIVGDFDNRQMDSMLRSQHHRGPDFTGKYTDEGNAILGHNRLAIIDLSPQSNQPFFDNSRRYAVVFNGEIYNYIELKSQLRLQYDFKTESDTEVLLAAYIVYGKEFLSKLNGMFAFAIWDNQTKKLFAARDRFGVKPFYYTQANDTFYFASEIKAIHAAGISKKPNETVWAAYFAYGSYGNPDETFWQNINQLPAGHFLEYENQALLVKKWYFFEEEVANQPKNLSYEKAKEHYLALLKDSIALRFRADVPVGFNISGGLDSSVLLALVNNFESQKGNINAYTFYTNNPDYDELPWVERMIETTKNPLKKVLLESSEVPVFSKKMQFQQDEPYGGIPTLAYAKIFEQARKDNVLVLLDGQGMDEQWAGYDYYTQSNEAIIQGVKSSPFKRNIMAKAFFEKAIKPKYPKPFAEEILNKQYRDLFFTKIPRALRFNDRISMAFSTELREPFLDYRLVEFAFSLPLEYKIQNGVNKFLLRDIASDFAPELLSDYKRPLQTPQREWLANDLKEWINDFMVEIKHSPYQSWFDIAELSNELQKYFDGDQNSSFHIWQFISFCQILKNETS